MDTRTMAEAASMFSTAAYETMYGSWTFYPDEYDDTIDPEALEDALWLVGDGYLLEVERNDGVVTLNLSTYYLKAGEPDEEFDYPYGEDTESEWLDAWDTAAACRLFAYVSGCIPSRLGPSCFSPRSGWVKQTNLIVDTILGEYVPSNEFVLEKCKAIFGDRVDDLEHGNWTLHATVREEA